MRLIRYDAEIRVGTKIDLNEFKKLNKEVETLENKFEKLKQKGDINEELGIKDTSRQMKRLDIDTENTYNALRKARAELETFQKANGLEGLSYDQAKAELDKLSESAKKSDSIFAKLGKRIKGLALRVFVFSLITKAFRSMLNSIREGFKNLAQYSKEYNSVLSAFKSSTATLKNSLATAFAPIVTSIIPYLTKLVDWLTIASDSVSRFFAILRGSNTFTKAKKQIVDYADSLKKANSETNKLASFDDLNVLDSDSGNGGSDASNMFEEVAIDESQFQWVVWLREHMDGILDVAEIIGATFIGWKISDSVLTFFKVVGLSATPIASVVGSLVAYGIALKDIAENGELTNRAFGLMEIAVLGIGIAFATILGPVALIPSAVAMIVVAVIKYKDQIVDAIKKAIKYMGDHLEKFWQNIRTGVYNIKEYIGRMGSAIKKSFVSVFEGAWEGIKKVLNFILGGVGKLVNGIINGINLLIDKLNKFGFELPEVLGGGRVGFNLAHIQNIEMPKLAQGGLVNRPTTALIGERGREAVLPLENNTEWMDVLADKIGSGNVTIKFDGSLSQLARVLNPVLDAESKRIGTRLIVE